MGSLCLLNSGEEYLLGKKKVVSSNLTGGSMKMLGKVHGPQCDCNCKFVSGASEKCNKKYGNSRQRAREKREWKNIGKET